MFLFSVSFHWTICLFLVCLQELFIVLICSVFNSVEWDQNRCISQFLLFYRDAVWIFFRHGRTFKVVVTEKGEVVDLTPCPKEVQNKSELRDSKITIAKVR